MNLTKSFLSLAALLSALAGVAVVLTPPPPEAPKGTPSASSGGMTLEARKSHGLVHTTGSDVYAEVSVRLPEDRTLQSSRAVSLVLVLDRSGSMDGVKLREAKRAAQRLVSLLGSDDELGFVHFGTDVVSTPRRKMTAENKAQLASEIEAVVCDGSTNLSAALTRAYEVLRGAGGSQRVVLVSDGQPTAGDTTADGLARLTDELHTAGVTLTALGVGHDYDGPLMQRLAERGGGMYGYLASAAMLEDVLGRELSAARRSTVRNVELELSATDGLFIVDVPGRSLERRGLGAVLQLADLQPGMTTRAWVHLRSTPALPGAQPTLSATVRWRQVEDDEVLHATVSAPFLVVSDAAAVEASRDEAVFAQAVTALGTVKLAAATAAYERGDDATALSLLGNARALFGLSANALAGTEEADRMQADYAKANALERKKLSRGLEKKFMSNFGKENEGY
ncbi:MAG: VWA domain-containing protein [Myxococcota bacterium]